MAGIFSLCGDAGLADWLLVVADRASTGLHLLTRYSSPWSSLMPAQSTGTKPECRAGSSPARRKRRKPAGSAPSRKGSSTSQVSSAKPSHSEWWALRLTRSEAFPMKSSDVSLSQSQTSNSRSA